MNATASNVKEPPRVDLASPRKTGSFTVLALLIVFRCASLGRSDDALEGLARPQEGRSMRATSTMRMRRSPAWRRDEAQSQGRTAR